MSLSDYFRSQAEWRSQKAAEYPEDERNARSADALYELADYVEPDEHGDYEADRQVLDALAPHLFDTVSFGGERTERAVVRYGFGYPVTGMHHAGFLEEVVTLCLIDAYEFAGEHGNDPTDTLFGFEVDAASRGVHLPDYYFERRRNWTEFQAEEAVREYSGDVVLTRDPDPDLETVRATWAERLHVEPDPEDPRVRYVVLGESRRVGKLVDEGETWSLFYCHGWVRADDEVMGGVEDADRHGVARVTEAIMSGELRPEEGV